MRYKSISTKQLLIDKRYQRELDSRRVGTIVEHFDPRQLGTLEVSARKGGKWAVFDGQHRLAALKKLKIDAAPCIAHTGLSPEEEAELFVALQRNRRSVRPLERFRARLFSGDQIAVGIQHVVDECGYRIPSSSGQWSDEGAYIQAINTIERMYRLSADDLRDTLRAAKMWNGDPKSTDGLLLEGLFLLQREYRGRLDGDAYANLAQVAPTTIIRRATGNAAGGGAWTAKAVMAELRKLSKVRGRPLKQRREQREAVAA